MIAGLKELKRSLDARAKKNEIARDEEGRALIEMTVKNDEDFLSDFSLGTAPTLSSSVAEFFEESAKHFLPKERIRLKIHSDCIDEEEEKIYAGAFKEYYFRRYAETKRDLNQNALVSLILAIVGVLTLALALLCKYFAWNEVLLEAIDIFAWVFLWEAVDLFFLERIALRTKRARYLHFLDAKIEFLPLISKATS